MPAGRADRRLPRTASSPATRGSSPATTAGSTGGGRSSSTRRRSSSSRRASSSRTSCSSTTAGRSASSLALRARPDGRRRRPRGLRPRQLRPPTGPPHDRDRDPLGLRRHLRRQGRPARPAGRAQHALVPVARRAADDLCQPRIPARAGRRRRTAGLAAAVRQRAARVRRRDRAEGRLAHLHQVAAGDAARCGAPTTLPCNAVDGAAPGAGLAAAAARSASRRRTRPSAGRGTRRSRDMEALRLEDPTFERGVFIPAAGVPVVRDPVRARLADRLDAGHLRLPGVRGGGAPPPGRAPGDRRRPRAGHGAGQDPPRDPPRRAGPAAGSCRSSRTTAPTTRRACT